MQITEKRHVLDGILGQQERAVQGEKNNRQDYL